MDDNREPKRLGDETGKVDRLSNLPESLLLQVLLNLPTKVVVKTSVLSSRWRNLWKEVPGLDLGYSDFPEYNTFVRFVDSFLGFDSEPCLQSFRLRNYYDDVDEAKLALIRRWINTVIKRKIKHIYVCDESVESYGFHMPPTIYTCESLVSLKLSGITLPSIKFVSLPSLKVIDLTIVHFADDLAFETLISSCPFLESLLLRRSLCDDTEVLRVRSQSLLKFTYVANGSDDLVEDLAVAIDAPRLEYLRLGDCRTASFILNNPGSLVEADIDTMFNLSSGKRFDPNDLAKRKMICNFLIGISGVKVMTTSSDTLEVIYDYSRCERLPLFRNLSFLEVTFYDCRWEMLPIFLESCPNLKSLVLGYTEYREEVGTNIMSGPRCFLSSLEYVEIQRPLKGEVKEMKLVSYLLENSTILKKLTVWLDAGSKEKEDSVILKELIAIPRLSSMCQVVVH